MMLDTFKYVLIGASGHAKVILDILENSGENILCLLELNPQKGNVFNYPVYKEMEFPISIQHRFIISIGDNKKRYTIASKFDGLFGLAKHPNASISNYVEIGEGTVIMSKVVINPDVKIGDHCIVNTSSIIEHDCILGDFVHISPGAILCGGVSIGEGTHIGAGAVILPGIKIGDWSTIGAGAVITKDVSHKCVVFGNPGRVFNSTNADENLT
ncbi:MAG: sugar O-acyltransferase (sialic acid O-acetyltransferase NeuD family) [Parvicella sp.]|jgi:sugar O-acyltransferase (sialic acid O-acetyltransferase NeuD family)